MQRLATRTMLGTSGRITRYDRNLYVMVAPVPIAFGVEEIQQDFRDIAILAKGDPVRMVVDARSVASSSIGARRLIGSRFPSQYGIIAFAVMTESALSRIIADFQMRFHHPPIPMRLFTDDQAALDWLDSIPLVETDPEAG